MSKSITTYCDQCGKPVCLSAHDLQTSRKIFCTLDCAMSSEGKIPYDYIHEVAFARKLEWAVYDKQENIEYENDDEVMGGEHFFLDMNGELLIGDPCWKVSPAKAIYGDRFVVYMKLKNYKEV